MKKYKILQFINFCCSIITFVFSGDISWLVKDWLIIENTKEL